MVLENSKIKKTLQTYRHSKWWKKKWKKFCEQIQSCPIKLSTNSYSYHRKKGHSIENRI